jgi:hypothetical protein
LNIAARRSGVGGDCRVDRWSAATSLAFEGGTAAVAFDVHLEDGGVMDEAVDDSDRHCLVREDLAPLPNGWLAVISRDRRSYRALISSKSTLVSAWSFGRVGVEIRAPRLDDGLVQQPGFGELVQRIVNGRQDTRIPEVTASPCNCSAMTWRSPMPESAEASSQLTHRWREMDSNFRFRASGNTPHYLPATVRKAPRSSQKGFGEPPG